MPGNLDSQGDQQVRIFDPALSKGGQQDLRFTLFVGTYVSSSDRGRSRVHRRSDPGGV